MKKLFFAIAFMAFSLFGCTDIENSIESLKVRVEALENESIPSVDGQIAAIKQSLIDLENMHHELEEYIDDLQVPVEYLQKQIDDTNSEIAKLKADLSDMSLEKAEMLKQLEATKAELEAELQQITVALAELQTLAAKLDQDMAALRNYVEVEISEMTSWVNATFATLEQQNQLTASIATISQVLEAYKSESSAALSQAVSNLESSLKSWVSDQLSGYYTIAQIDTQLQYLQQSIANGNVALAEELNALEAQLSATKLELTEAYQNAIRTAIEEHNGVITSTIASQIASVNSRIDNEIATINNKITNIENRLNNIETQLSNLLSRIQSVSYIPTYSDGKATVKYLGDAAQLTLDFEVSPKDAVEELAKVWQSAVSVKAIYTQTRAVTFIDMPIVDFTSDATNGVISLIASAANLSDEFLAGTKTVSARLSISDGNNSVTSEYIPLVAQAITNELWYTSSDGKVVTPYSTTVFGANIVSNEYKDGKGVITFDGPVTSIGERAFYASSSTAAGRRLTSVIIPNSVTSIDTYAFYYCSGLTSVTIPNSVTSIGNSAFAYCSGLTSVIIPNSVTSIGERAFYYCSSLKSVAIPNSVTSIDTFAFYYCSGLTSVTIPNSVTSIGDRAFARCNDLNSFNGKFATSDGRCLIVDGVLKSFAPAGLTNYTIPNSVTSIGNYAFSYCSGLTSITIPNSVTSIGNYAFADCDGLTSVTIPEKVTSIGTYAFRDCDNLKEVYCKPTTPPTAKSNMFTNTSSELCIYVKYESLEDYKTATGWTTYKDKITTNLNEIYYTSSDGKVVEPYSTTVFGANIVSNEYKDGKGVITFDGPVTSIGHQAFYASSSTAAGRRLTSVIIPNSVTSIGNYAFRYCDGLTSVIIPNSVTSIGNYAFCYCSGLTSVTIPNSVTSIGNYALQNCTSLTSVTIPNSVTSIGNNPFCDCYKLNSFNGKFATTDGRCLIADGVLISFAPSGLTNYTIPNSVTSIGNYAFYYCSGLTSVTIPNSVTSIGDDAFAYCSSLTSVTIGNSVTSIEEHAFAHCSSLTSITIPNRVTSIGNNPFYGCYKLNSFNGKFATTDGRCLIADGVLKSFAPSGLTNYTIPNSATSIGVYAFAYCFGLTSVTIPNSVTSIGNDAFLDCDGLTSVTIPNSVTSIDNGAFYHCSSLTSVYCKPTTPPTGGNYMFSYYNNGYYPLGCKIYVPSASVSAYKAKQYWSDYASYIYGYNF